MKRMKNIRGFRILFENKSNYVSIFKLKFFYPFSKLKSLNLKAISSLCERGEDRNLRRTCCKIEHVFLIETINLRNSWLGTGLKEKIQKKGKRKMISL